MGQNSTEVAYGFGQQGSAFMNISGKAIIPPQGKVIVAITSLIDGLQFSELIAEDNPGASFLSTDTSDEDNCNYHGVYESNITNGTYAAGANITITADAAVKVGQYVLVIKQADTINAGLTLNAGMPVPNYSETNKAGCKVDTINTAGTVITLQGVGNSDCGFTASSDAIMFLDDGHGAGGTGIDSANIPAGVTITGRWTKVVPAGQVADGGIICYFGY